ncbi:MAG: DUF6152 family protein [Steroidobacteraceae bacterium]
MKLFPALLNAKLRASWIACMSLAPLAATAHHSYAMFDRSKSVSSEAIVRIWEFTNPHATLWVYINDAQGKPVLWGVEAAGPTQLLRSGWDKNTVKPGDKVTVVINPLRNGSNGGSLVKLTLADGRSLGAGGAPAAENEASKEPAKAP